MKNISEIENLVFQGGGIRGIAYVGALNTLCNAQLPKHQRLDLSKIKRVGGSSAGAITALYLALGKDLDQINDLRKLNFNTLLDYHEFKNIEGFYEGTPSRGVKEVVLDTVKLLKAELFYPEAEAKDEPIPTLSLLALLFLKLSQRYIVYSRRFVSSASADIKKEARKIEDQSSLQKTFLGLLAIPLKELGISLFNNYGHELFDSIIKYISAVSDSQSLRQVEKVVKDYLETWCGGWDFDFYCESLFALLLHIHENEGAFSGKALEKQLIDDIKQEKLDPKITFKQLYLKKRENKNLKDLYVIALDMNMGVSKVFSYEHTPNVVIIDAVRASMSIPIFFQTPTIRQISDGKEEKLASAYADGGLFDNYPIWLFDKAMYVNDSGLEDMHPIYNTKTLGMRLITQEEKYLYESRFENMPAEIAPAVLSQDAYLKQMVKLPYLMAFNKQHNDHYHSGDLARTIYISTQSKYDLFLMEDKNAAFKIETILKSNPILYKKPILIKRGAEVYIYGCSPKRWELTLLDSSQFGELVFSVEPTPWRPSNLSQVTYREITLKKGHIPKEIHTVQFNLSDVDKSALMDSGADGAMYFLKRKQEFPSHIPGCVPLNEDKLPKGESKDPPKPKFPLSGSPLHSSHHGDRGRSQPSSALQNQLVIACEQGDLKAVETLINQGANSEIANEKGKRSLGAAVWSMNPQLVSYLLAKTPALAEMNWDFLEKHNKEHYGEVFLITAFMPLNFNEWLKLIDKIKLSSFTSQFYLVTFNTLAPIGDRNQSLEKLHNVFEIFAMYETMLNRQQALGLGREWGGGMPGGRITQYQPTWIRFKSTFREKINSEFLRLGGQIQQIVTQAASQKYSAAAFV